MISYLRKNFINIDINFGKKKIKHYNISSNYLRIIKLQINIKLLNTQKNRSKVDFRLSLKRMIENL